MVSLTALWLPILLSAVAVFVASSLIHAVLGLHNSDYQKIPDEDEVLAAMRKGGLQPGFYSFPHAKDMKEMGNPEMQEKMKAGPCGLMSVGPSGMPSMGKMFGSWFAFCVVIGIFAAYMASRTLDAGADYLAVFRVTGTVAFLAYSASEPIASIWKYQPWGVTMKHVFDGLVYALLTGGIFGWLWPS